MLIFFTSKVFIVVSLLFYFETVILINPNRPDLFGYKMGSFPAEWSQIFSL